MAISFDWRGQFGIREIRIHNASTGRNIFARPTMNSIERFFYGSAKQVIFWSLVSFFLLGIAPWISAVYYLTGIGLWLNKK